MRGHRWWKWWTGPAPDPTSSWSEAASAPDSQALASAAAAAQLSRCGRSAASAEESEQPVPWVLFVRIQGPGNSTWLPSGSTSASVEVASSAVPPGGVRGRQVAALDQHPGAGPGGQPAALVDRGSQVGGGFLADQHRELGEIRA